MNPAIHTSKDSRLVHRIGDMGDWLAAHRRQRPTHTALVFAGVHESYAQIDAGKVLRRELRTQAIESKPVQ